VSEEEDSVQKRVETIKCTYANRHPLYANSTHEEKRGTGEANTMEYEARSTQYYIR
jgi:hypothetical protein